MKKIIVLLVLFSRFLFAQTPDHTLEAWYEEYPYQTYRDVINIEKPDIINNAVNEGQCTLSNVNLIIQKRHNEKTDTFFLVIAIPATKKVWICDLGKNDTTVTKQYDSWNAEIISPFSTNNPPDNIDSAIENTLQ